MNLFFMLAYKLSDRDTQKLIDEDIARCLKWDNISPKTGRLKKLEICCRQQPFRNVLVFRLEKSGKVTKLLGRIGCLFSPIYKTIEIGGDIKGGLMVSHGFSIIYVRSAGKNLRVGPGVVIGRNGNTFPVIGNNVYVAANSTVIGNIVIGDNVIIGAGSTVTKDIPSDSVVCGNPAKVIRKIEERDLNEIM